VLSKDKVNIVVHGHIPFLSEKIVEWARKLDDEAKAVGAAGIQLSRHLLHRQRGADAPGRGLCRQLSLPGAGHRHRRRGSDGGGRAVHHAVPWPRLSACYHTKLVTTHPIGKIPGAEHVDFRAEHADEDAQKIVRMGIANFRNRDKAKVRIPDHKAEMWGGFSRGGHRGRAVQGEPGKIPSSRWWTTSPPAISWAPWA
jgi:carbon-monoxide dehydrogenase catalytic subunit